MLKDIQAYVFPVLLFIALASCKDDLLDSPYGESDKSPSEYWYTRTLTPAQEKLLHRSFGLGFSYDAIRGAKCDMGSVKCNVLNLDGLNENGRLSINDAPITEFKQWIAHSFTEFCQMTNLTENVSANVVVYSKEYAKASAIYEHGLDTTVCIHNEHNVILRRGGIQTRGIRSLLQQHPEVCLSESFLYALQKLQKSNAENVLVVDSFINIFGTHVITNATIGGGLTLEVQSSNLFLNDYSSETTITKEAMNVFFKEESHSITTDEKKFIHQVLNNSNVSLSVKGGNASVFNSLVANPFYTNADATVETLNKWIASLSDIDLNDTSKESAAELIDMRITPIWEFIPDESIAKRVQSRVIATAPTMQELYGNRNWVSTRFNYDINDITTVFSPKKNPQSMTFDTPWVFNIIAANRHVATVCREWVPEISKDQTVTVVYPIYNNKADLSLGLCEHAGKVYRVKWRYDRFEVQEDTTMNCSDGTLYLTFGTLSTAPYGEVQDYLDGHHMIAYEWPGSIKAQDGSVLTEGWLTTRKFLGDFYLENNNRYDNLPNWTYQTDVQTNAYYQHLLNDGQPFSLSGLTPQSVTNRMVRNDDYTYYINTNEAWYEKLD